MKIYSVLKYSFDLIISLIILGLIWPFILLLAILIHCKLGSPIIFNQTRIGLHNKKFNLYKFRSMTNQRDENGQLLPDMQRLTKFGKFIRTTSLDELPQLFNVLKGELSLVGPRPLLVEYLPLYSAEQARRHEVKPGITGWAQINGRNAISWEEKFKLDVWYVNHRSFWLDIKIIWLTFLKVIRREDISASGHSTMEKFTGKNEG